VTEKVSQKRYAKCKGFGRDFKVIFLGGEFGTRNSRDYKPKRNKIFGPDEGLLKFGLDP
jgi:hypothetical protein